MKLFIFLPLVLAHEAFHNIMGVTPIDPKMIQGLTQAEVLDFIWFLEELKHSSDLVNPFHMRKKRFILPINSLELSDLFY